MRGATKTASRLISLGRNLGAHYVRDFIREHGRPSWGPMATIGNAFLVALDSAHDRRAVQGSLPRWVANAWTQAGDLGVSTHSFLGPDACLACLYLPTQKSKNEDQIVAESLKIPQFQDKVRFLLGSGQPTDKELCDAVATAWGVPSEKVEPYVGRSIRELWGGGCVWRRHHSSRRDRRCS